MNYAHAVIYRSADGRTKWEPVLPDDVPEFVRQPDVMGRLLQGEMCMDAKDESRIISLSPKKHAAWYRAIPFKAM